MAFWNDSLASKRVEKTPDCMARDIEGEVVLLSLATEQYHGLDEVGTRFWNTLLEAPDVAEAVRRLLGEYDVPLETLREDVAELIASLQTRGLVTLVDARQ